MVKSKINVATIMGTGPEGLDSLVIDARRDYFSSIIFLVSV